MYFGGEEQSQVEEGDGVTCECGDSAIMTLFPLFPNKTPD
jgi:hypothetical protein